MKLNEIPGFEEPTIKEGSTTPEEPFKPMGGRAGGHMAAARKIQQEPEGPGMQSITNGFNEFVLALPDAVIDAGIFAAEKAGLLDDMKNVPLNDRRGYLTRFFNESNYDEKRKLWGMFNVGAGEKKPLTNPMEVAGDMMGRGLGASVGMITGAAKVLPAVADSAISATGVKIGEKAPGVFSQTATDLSRSFQSAPASFAAADAAGNVGAAIGASAGKTIEKEALGTDTGIGEMVGGTGLAAPKMVGEQILRTVPSWVLNTGKSIANNGITGMLYRGAKTAGGIAMIRFSPDAERRASHGVINSAMEEAYRHADVTGNRETMDRIRAFAEENGMPMPRLSVAEETGDPTLIYEQRRLESAATGDQARQNAIRRQENIDWAKGFQNHVLGTDDSAPSMVVNVLKEGKADQLSRLDNQEADLQYRTGEAASRVPRVKDRAEQGDAIRQAVLKEKEAAKEEMNILADVLKIDLKGRPRGVQKVKQDIQTKFFEDNEVLQAGVPNAIRKIALMDEKTMDYQEWGKFRVMIGDELGEAIAKKQSGKVTQLAEFKQYWDDFGDRAFGELGENGKIFREAYAKRYVPFESGVAYKVTKPTEFDRPWSADYKTRDEMVADAFLVGKKEAKEFMTLTQNQPEAREAMKKIIWDKANEFSQPSQNSPYAGGLDPVKLQKYLNRNREALDAMGLQDDVKDAAHIMTEVGIRNAELAARRKAINQDMLNRMLDKEADGEMMTATEIFDKALANTEVMQRLSQRVKDTRDPALMEQLRNGLASRLTDQHPMENPEAFLKAINDKKVEDRLLKVFSKEHLTNIALAAEAMRHVKMVGQEANIGSGIDQMSLPAFIQKVTGTSAVMISSLARAASEGRNSWHNAAMILGSRFIGAKQGERFNQKLWDAMMDPEKARDMAIPLDGRHKLPGSVDRRIKSWMFNLGVGAEEETEPKTVEGVPGLDLGGGAPKAPPPPAPTNGSPTPLMQTPDAAPPPAAPGPSPAPPAPPNMQGGNPAQFSSLFPYDELGGAIAARGYADGGFVVPESWRMSENVEDRRLEDPTKDEKLRDLLEFTNNRGKSAALRQAFANEYGEAMTRKRTKAEQAAMEKAIHLNRKAREKGYPLAKDPFLREMGSMLEPRESPRPKLASELEWGEKPGTMTKAMGIESLLPR